MVVKNTHSVTKTEISVFGRQALDAERQRSPYLADKVLIHLQIYQNMNVAYFILVPQLAHDTTSCIIALIRQHARALAHLRQTVKQESHAIVPFLYNTADSVVTVVNWARKAVVYTVCDIVQQ